MNRLRQTYKEKIAPKMKKDHKLGSVMEVPRIKKIVVNSGIGDIKDSRESIESFVEEFTQLLGQKPHPTKARQSISGFKIRKGDVVGYTATLRGDRMWAFLDKLINVAIPRIRDFRGLKTDSFDNSGNYSLGINEHVIFPEVNPNTAKSVRPLQVTIVSTSDDKNLNKELLDNLGMPFRRGQ